MNQAKLELNQKPILRPINKKAGKSFSSFFSLKPCQGLKVDLSEAQMKISEANNVPLSSRHA
jgi:hypothetical protein